MVWEIYKGRIVELHVLPMHFRYSGKCLDVVDGFITIENDRNGRILSFRIADIETIREVQ